MLKLAFLASALSLALLAGCVHSINGAYTEEAGTFNRALVGSWQSENEQDTWGFAKSSDHGYICTLTDGDGLSGEFEVMMFEAGGHQFLDFFPVTGDEGEASTPYYDYHFFPMHTFMLVRETEPSLVLSLPDPDWISTYLASNPDAVGHSKGEVLVLTDEPEKVQGFLSFMADEEEAFVDMEPMAKL